MNHPEMKRIAIRIREIIILHVDSGRLGRRLYKQRMHLRCMMLTIVARNKDFSIHYLPAKNHCFAFATGGQNVLSFAATQLECLLQ
ncbi:MAG: hypothetical protein K0R48_1005 [Gammaproteobacteria bacterium]|nr:hypothetical protein [Gammaproteobacteria bacterium]